MWTDDTHGADLQPLPHLAVRQLHILVRNLSDKPYRPDHRRTTNPLRRPQCTQAAVSRSTSLRPVQERCRSMSSVLNRLMVDSISALSRASPIDPIDPAIPASSRPR
jgi:hypothetical protein